MKNIKNISKDLIYVGASDRTLSLFESVYPVPRGVSYNSYLLLDEKTALFDTVDKHAAGQFFENVEAALEGRELDYLIINHLEPDHSAMIKCVLEKYKNAKIVSNAKIKAMLPQFFEYDFDSRFITVKEGETFSTGSHTFAFVTAPMVHWPEVMVTYDATSKTLFSADAFGSFGAIDGNLFDDETELDIPEYRRYYTNIVGKYGPQVSALLKKASSLDIKTICPLHGVVLRAKIPQLLDLYTKWASYTPEINSVLIPYTSVYGNTQNAAEIIASKLADKGVKNIKMYDVSQTHDSYVLSDAFKYSHIVLATTTYNNNVFVNMENFINDLVKHNLQNRTFAIVENGSWMPNCGTTLQGELAKLKNCKVIENKVTIKSSLKKAQEEEIDALVEAVATDLKE